MSIVTAERSAILVPKDIVKKPRQPIVEGVKNKWVATERTLQPESVKEVMLLNTLGVSTLEGKVYKVHTEPTQTETGLTVVQFYRRGEETVPLQTITVEGEEQRNEINSEALKELDFFETVPLSSNYDHSMMDMLIHPDYQSILDFPPNILLWRLARQMNRVNVLQKDGPVDVGENIYLAGLLRERGGRSVMFNHIVEGQDKDQAPTTQDEVEDARAQSRWDNGVSEYIGEQIAQEFKNGRLSQYRKEGEPPPNVRAGKMGVSVWLHGVTPDYFASPESVHGLMLPFYSSMQGQMDDVFRSVFEYEGGLKGVTEYIRKNRLNGQIDKEWFKNNFFAKKKDRSDVPIKDSTVVRTLHDLYEQEGEEKLLFPPGWTFLASFQERGTLFVATPGILHTNIGLRESTATAIDRPENYFLPPDKMNSNRRRYNTVFDASGNGLQQKAA